MSHASRVVAVTGGKGGVGKSNVSLNLAIGLAELGRKVTLLDADLGLGNIDVLLGLKAKHTLEDVLNGDMSIADIMVEGPRGIRVVPAASGTASMVHLDVQQHAGLIQAFSEVSDDIDVLIVDTAAGISESVTSFVRAAQEVLVVVCDEPTSITDAYALIKLLNIEHGMTRFKLVTNLAKSRAEGEQLYRKLTAVADRFLDVSIELVGIVPFDESVRRAVQKQKAVIEAYPASKAAKAYRDLARRVDSWPIARSPRGHLEFFVEQLVSGGVA